MAEEEKKQQETAPTSPELPEGQAANAEALPHGATPTEVAGANLERMRAEIETQRQSKQQRAEFLEKEARAKRDTESWVNQPANEYKVGGNDLRSGISDAVEESAKENMEALAKAGFDETNIRIIKGAIKILVFEYCSKTFSSLIGQTDEVKRKLGEYSDSVLTPKLTNIIGEMQRLYESRKNMFPSAIACWEGFSSFSGLNFMSKGLLDGQKLKEAFTLDAATIDFQLKSFEQYLNIQGELTTLSGQEANLALSGTAPAAPATPVPAAAEAPAPEQTPAEPTPSPAENPSSLTAPETAPKPAETAPVENAAAAAAVAENSAVAALFAKGTLRLNSKVRFLIPATAAERELNIRTSLTSALPASLETTNKETAITYLLSELEKLNPAENETYEISENGTWQKVDVEAEQTQIDASRQQAEEQIAEAKKESSPTDLAGIIKQFMETNPILGAIIGFILTLFGIQGLEALTGTDEFMALDSVEKAEAGKMKESMGKIGLNMKTMHALFIDGPKTKEIIKQRKDENQPTWDDYLAQHLNQPELSELKLEKTISAQDIAAMILSPNEAAPQNPLIAQNQPQAQPVPAAPQAPTVQPAPAAQTPPLAQSAPTAAQPTPAPQAPPATPPQAAA